MMMFQKQENFILSNFEGPIDFLVHLIHKEELNIYDVPIHQITNQFIEKLLEWNPSFLEWGAEFISTAAYLVWLKSKTLLPPSKEEPVEEILEEDPNFEIIHHLIDYCQFKQTAKELALRQEEQKGLFCRGLTETPEFKRPLGIDHISLEELSSLFREMMNRAGPIKQTIQEENWKVSDKIKAIKILLKEKNRFEMQELFPAQKSRLEWIVTFLALLELMKIGIVGVGRQQDIETIIVFAKEGS